MRISDWSSDVCSSDLVDPARPFHLAHMIDQILRVVSLIAALRLVAVFQPRLAPRGLGDALRLRVFVVLLAVASLGGICFGFAGIVDHGRLLSGIARKRAGPDRRSSGRRRAYLILDNADEDFGILRAQTPHPSAPNDNGHT